MPVYPELEWEITDLVRSSLKCQVLSAIAKSQGDVEAALWLDGYADLQLRQAADLRRRADAAASDEQHALIDTPAPPAP